MHCHDEKQSLRGKSDAAVIRQLAHERNQAFKSRDAWIAAAFDLKYGKPKLFNELVEKELCQNCQKNFTKNVTKN